MKKLILLLNCLILFSCGEYKIEPIEKYRNKGIVVIKNSAPYRHNSFSLRCKTKDSIFYIVLIDFDAKNLKIGDTL